MNCKFCGKKLEGDSLICNQCGRDNSQKDLETSGSQRFPWKAVLMTLGCVLLMAVLAWVVYFGVTGRFLPRKNDVYYKESYTADADAVDANNGKIVATMGDDKLTNGQLQVFYGMQVIDYLNTYGYGWDMNEPLHTQICDEETGLTWQQYFLENALNTWKQYRIITNKAKEANFQLEPTFQEELDNVEERLQKLVEQYKFESIEALIQADVGPGCTLADYKYYMELYYYGKIYPTSEAKKLEITDEELETYFTEYEDKLLATGITKDSGFLSDVRHIVLVPEGGTTGADGKTVVYSQAELEACRKEIQALLDQWLAGEKTEESFAALAKEKSDDQQSAENGGLTSYLGKQDMVSVDVRHILIQPEGGTKSEDGKTTVYSEAEWEACRVAAQSILDSFLAGEQTEERFGQLAKEHTADGNGSVGGIYMDVTKGYMVEAFDAWIFDESRTPGDTGLVKTEFGYHVMYFVHRDDAVAQWIFAEERTKGDYALVQADYGWHLMYYVEGEPGWKRLCRGGVMSEKTDALLEDMVRGYEMQTNYKNILLGEADL